jgi:bacterioferritin-associated ferredoxin
MDDPTCSSSPRPLCHCLNVTAEEIRTAIDLGGLHTVRQVGQACGAGSGCTSCHRHIKRLLAQSAQERQAESVLEPLLGFA